MLRQVDFVYTVFIKVRYNVDEFFMVGNQFGFNYTCKSDIEGLITVASIKLEEYMVAYNLTDDAIVYIKMTFRQKDKKLLSEFYLIPGIPCNAPQASKDSNRKENIYHVPLLSKPDQALVESNLAIPVSINKDSLGKPLSVDTEGGVITDIHMEIDGVLVNFL